MYEFMLMTMYRLYPNIDEYPLDDMRNVEHTQGDGFDNTKYEGIKYLQDAYHMHELVTEFRNRMWDYR
jgi:hypothetical protein